MRSISNRPWSYRLRRGTSDLAAKRYLSHGVCMPWTAELRRHAEVDRRKAGREGGGGGSTETTTSRAMRLQEQARHAFSWTTAVLEIGHASGCECRPARPDFDASGA